MSVYTDMKYRQQVVGDWVSERISPESLTSLEERGLRTGEEGIEVMQVCGVSREQAHALVDRMYDRPVGELTQEIGGLTVTLLTLCQGQGIDFVAALDVEIARILSKPKEHWQARQNAKADMGLGRRV